MQSALKKFLNICDAALLPSIAIIPLLKILTLTYKINLPLQYIPTIALTAVCLINQHKNWIKILALNGLILYYAIIAYDFPITALNLTLVKNQVAAFVYLNTLLIVYFRTSETPNKDYFHLYAKTLLWSSIAILFLCYLSLYNALVNNNIKITIEDVKNLLLFSRTEVGARSSLISFINPVRYLAYDYSNMKMIGPQLLINPLILFFLTLIKPNYLKKYLLAITLLASIPLVIALNSRAFALTIIVALLIVTFKNIPKHLHSIYIIALGAVPFLITTLKTSLLNGRQCQIDFVQNHLSAFGNGISSKQNELNSTCGEILNIKNYQTIQSITYDNIHIEATHYFGYVPYLILLIFLINKGILSNSYKTRILYMLIFIFFSLNLNLFEIYFAPFFALFFNQNINKINGNFATKNNSLN